MSRKRKLLHKLSRESYRFAQGLPKQELTIMPDLCGACALASAHFVHSAQQHGFNARMVLGAQHAFARVGDYYVDITAEQFGDDLRLWVRKHPPDYTPPWEEEFSNPSLAEVLTWMSENNWSWDAKKIREYVLKEAA